MYLTIYNMISVVNVHAYLTQLTFFHYIFDMYDESKSVDVMYLDYQKMFVKVHPKTIT